MAFTPTNYGTVAAQAGVSTLFAIPGGAGAALVVSNIGGAPAVVLLGTTGTVVTGSTGMAVLPGQAVTLGVGANDHIAVIGIGATAVLNLAQGT